MSSSAAFLILHAVQSYILLTANLEDVHAIAKQLANSPVADQLRRIWRRASAQFSKQIARHPEYKKRADEEDQSIGGYYVALTSDNTVLCVKSGSL